jgi:hypothetical protein
VRAPQLVTALASALLALTPVSARADEAQHEAERNIKAAFLYKFAGYVEWPDAAASGGGPLTIGVVGADALARELARITAGRTISDRPILVRQVADGESLAGLQILFVGAEPGVSFDDSVARARGQPILVVTDAPGALASGSVINFTFERDRVRFEVSLPAAERSRLKLSSRLLAVAQRVQRTES